MRNRFAIYLKFVRTKTWSRVEHAYLEGTFVRLEDIQITGIAAHTRLLYSFSKVSAAKISYNNKRLK